MTTYPRVTRETDESVQYGLLRISTVIKSSSLAGADGTSSSRKVSPLKKHNAASSVPMASRSGLLIIANGTSSFER